MKELKNIIFQWVLKGFRFITTVWFIILFLQISCIPSKDSTFTNRRKILNYKDSTIHFHIVLPNNLDIDQKNDKQYHWFFNGKIGLNSGGYAGNLLCDEYLVFDTLDCLRTKGFFNQGLKHGIWIKWNSKGEIISSEMWKKGYLHNLSYYYNLENEEELTLKYKNGVLHGRSVLYLKNGERQVRRYRNGRESINFIHRLYNRTLNVIKVKDEEVDEQLND